MRIDELRLHIESAKHLSFGMTNLELVAEFQKPFGVIDGDEISMGVFVGQIMPALSRLNVKSAAVQSKWDRLLRLLVGLTTVRMTNRDVVALLDAAEADGVLTVAERAVIGKRLATYAETIFGAGTVITRDQIALARASTPEVMAEVAARDAEDAAKIAALPDSEKARLGLLGFAAHRHDWSKDRAACAVCGFADPTYEG